MDEKIRVLVAKPGLDGHDRGALIVAQALRDAGMEVIYTGLRQTPEQIVHAAIQEDVDVIGLSSLSGAHLQLFPEVTRLLHEMGAESILVVGGGVIPEEDFAVLREAGIEKIFTPGSNLKEMVSFIEEEVRLRREKIQDFAPISPESIDHIGIAVENLEASLSFYERMGLSPSAIEVVEEEKVRVAMIPIGSSRIELLESTSAEGTIARFIEKRGEGIHHIALQINDLNEYLEQLSDQGIQPIQPAPRKGAHGSLVAFLPPKEAHGVLIELVQPGDRHEE